MVDRHSRRVALDLDGVLIDSRRAVEAAYRTAGITMPPDAWGRPWSAWLFDVAERASIKAYVAHKMKQAAYPAALAETGQPLAGAIVATTLDQLGIEVIIVTAASCQSATDALHFLGLSHLRLMAGVEKKADVLSQLAPACYVDDQLITAPVPIVPFVNDPIALSAAIWRHIV